MHKHFTGVSMAVVAAVVVAISGAGAADAAPTPKPIPNSVRSFNTTNTTLTVGSGWLTPAR